MKIRILTGFLAALFVLLALVFLPHIAVSVIYLLICGLALYELMIALGRNFSALACNYCISEFILICFSTMGVVLVFDNYLMAFLIGLSVLVDTGGYVFGKMFGKTKLAFLKKYSPNKTLEGYIGAFITSWVLGTLLCWALRDHLPSYAFWFACLNLAFVPAVLGDLYESAIKRLLNVKDSGDVAYVSGPKFMQIVEKIIRSHGGYLDRIDSFIFVSITYVVFNSFFKPQ